MEKAGKDNLIVVTHDDLLDLLQGAFEGILEDMILRRLLRLFPPSMSGPYGRSRRRTHQTAREVVCVVPVEAVRLIVN